MKRKYKDLAKAKFQQDLIMKYLSVLTHDEYEELQKKLDEIDAIEDSAKKEEQENNLKLWLASKYVMASNLCISCSVIENCKRNKTNVKSCKLWKGKDNNE